MLANGKPSDENHFSLSFLFFFFLKDKKSAETELVSLASPPFAVNGNDVECTDNRNTRGQVYTYSINSSAFLITVSAETNNCQKQKITIRSMC